MILPYKNILPRIAEDVKILPGAKVIGEVEIGKNSSVWFNTVVRGDSNYIRIGENTNIQDLSMVHPTKKLWPVNIGNGITIGHNVIVHGCTIADNCLIGMGAIILDGAVINENTIVGAGALVTERKEFPPNVLLIGQPARVKREVTEEDLAMIRHSAQNYYEYAANYPDELNG